MELLPSLETEIQYLDPTWSVLDREPGMDDLAEGAGAEEMIKKMGESLKIYPFQDSDGEDRLFLARFEFPKYGEDMKFPEAITKGTSVAFIDFLAGFPIDCVEMLVAIGEFSSQPYAWDEDTKKVAVREGTGLSPPVPKGESRFFRWPEIGKIFLNLTALVVKDVDGSPVAKILARNLDGEPKPEKAHWWFRVQLMDRGPGNIATEFPVPGEFLGLGVRMFPGMYWGRQKSSPFVYSGNWMDTVYYSGARIMEVIEPSEDGVPYPTYKVAWRQDEFMVNPSDFAEYRVGDRVTILKDVATTKKTQLWKDDDMKEFGENWMIVPISFYALEIPRGG
jgi:hypothetical protein